MIITALTWEVENNLIYTLKETGFKRGAPILENATTVRVEGDNAEEITKLIHDFLQGIKFDKESLINDLIHENGRAVKQALENYKNSTPSNPDNGAMWDTCFKLIVEKHLTVNS